MKKIIFLGLLAFLLAALWQLPLSFAKPYAEKYVRGLQLKGVSGTVWNGEAQQLITNNRNLEKVTWKVKPFESLKSFTLKFDFAIKGRDLNAKGLAGITPNKTLVLNNTQFELSTNYINQQQRFAKLAGDISGSIKYAELNQQDLPLIDGIINWTEAAVTSPMKLAQGDYHAVISPQSGTKGLDIQLSSSDAPVELAGKITLNKEWIYKTDLNIKAIDPNLAPMMGMLGKKQANGVVNIKKQGDLKPFIGK